MEDEYADLKATVGAAGFFTTFQPIESPGDRIVCASHQYTGGPGEGGLGGNSFWVATRGRHWYVAGWGPAIYRVSDATRVGAIRLCLLGGERQRAYFDFDDDDVIHGFGLISVPDEEFGGADVA